LRSPTDAHPPGFHYHEGILQPRAQLRHRFHHSRGLGLARTTVELHEDNACRLAPARVHQLAEVAVLCPENAPIFRHSARRSPKSAQISCFAVSRSDMKDCDEHMPVMSTCLSLNARSITRSSTAPLATSAIASTSWSAWRSAKITGPAQRSSARNFTLQRLVTAGPSESSTTSSWATLAAP